MSMIPGGRIAKGANNFVKISESVLKSSGIDAHLLKQAFLGAKAPIAKFDLYRCKNTNEIFIFLKGGKGTPIPTGQFLN